MKYNTVCQIAYEAGEKILEIYNNDYKINFKEDKSPLTIADLESNKIIIGGLTKLKNNYPILSEESFVPWNERKKWNIYWLIDPLDGTKEFINKNGQFTINIALIKNNLPVFGVIYAPVLKKLYFGYKDNGAYLIKIKNTLDFSKAKKIFASKIIRDKKIKIVGSKSHSNSQFDIWINKTFINYELLKAGSSLKFCMLAEGNADIYPRFGPTSEWDIGAAIAILNEANCEINGINEEITFNQKENILNPFFIAKNKYLKY